MGFSIHHLVIDLRFTILTFRFCEKVKYRFEALVTIIREKQQQQEFLFLRNKQQEF